MNDAQRRRRDPQGRKQAIIEAAADLIVERGVGYLTHRNIAARAKVPLGSTTQHFVSLDELKTKALSYLAQWIDAALAEMALEIERDGCTPEVLSRIFHRYFKDTMRVQADAAFYAASIEDPSLRPLATHWWRGMVALLSRHRDPATAQAIAIFADGGLIFSVMNGKPPSETEILEILRKLMQTSA